MTHPTGKRTTQHAWWVKAQPTRRSDICLRIHQEVADVAVLHDIGLPFDAKLAGGADLLLRLVRFQVAEGVDLRADEALLEVGVDHPRRLRSGRPDGHGPGAN